ncbi:MAG: class I SAM-dependent methyltransferase [Hyphomicrobiaceae bacterium]
MDDRQTDRRPPGGDYNLVPYVSKPFPQTQPARLAALAVVFGLAPPGVETARVLELGSASGGNLIPLALRFPNARFHGIDLAERHVAEGRARVAALGLDNVTIEQGDIGILDLGDAVFDYIICHGVYSWVPEQVRAAILALSARHLAPDGVAYVSYNVLPGWHLRRAVRDLMLFHAGSDGPPADRVARARRMLDDVARVARDTTSFGALMRAEAQTLSAMEDSYILGEFLAEDNAPCYFRDFAAEAEAHGLAYLCEAELDQCLPETLGAETARHIRSLSGDKLIPLEQYMDFFKGRSFRQSLLVGRENGRGIRRRLEPGRFAGLHVAARGTVAEDSSGTITFTTPAGGTLTSRHPGVAFAFRRLNAVFPATRALTALAAEARAEAGRDWPDLDAAIADAVFKAALAGLAELSSVARSTPTDGVPARPRASSLARLDAREGTGWTTGLDHSVITLDVVTEAMLDHLDGNTNAAELEQHLLAAVASGRIRLIDNATGAALAGEALRIEAAEHVRLALGRLASSGLLS